MVHGLSNGGLPQQDRPDTGHHETLSMISARTGSRRAATPTACQFDLLEPSRALVRPARQQFAVVPDRWTTEVHSAYGAQHPPGGVVQELGVAAVRQLDKGAHRSRQT